MRTADDAPRIALVIETRHLAGAAVAEMCDALAAAGCELDRLVPDSDAAYALELGGRHDLVLSRGRDLAGLALAATLAADGTPALCAPAAVELVRNKVAMHAALARHEVRMPRTWFAHDPHAFRVLPLPLVVKPADGDGSAGIHLVTHERELRDVACDRRTLWLAQELIPTDGHDLKLYGIGRRIWAVRKPSPVVLDRPGLAAVSAVSGAEPVELTPDLRDLALTCGRACGLEFWGVDVAVGPDGPVVIEVNDFPTYSAVDGAGAALASHALRTIELHRLRRKTGRDRMRAMVRDGAA